MLKLSCTPPNPANICLNRTTDVKFYPFTERDNYLLEKMRDVVVGGPPIVFTRKAVVDETFIPKSESTCQSIFGIDASQLHKYSMCQPMLTGLYTLWDLNPETSRLTPREDETRSCEIMIMSYFQRQRTE